MVSVNRKMGGSAIDGRVYWGSTDFRVGTNEVSTVKVDGRLEVFSIPKARAVFVDYLQIAGIVRKIPDKRFARIARLFPAYLCH